MDFEARLKALLGELVFADARNASIIAQLQQENAALKKAAEDKAEPARKSKS